MSQKIFEIRKYWPRIPLAPVGHKICVYENRLAFRTEKELGTYHGKYSPSCPIYRKWKCPVCNGYHFLSKEMPGSGGSSGNQRENTYLLPRAEWDGKIPPEEAGTQFHVLVFSEKEREDFGLKASSEVFRRLRGYGVKIEWPQGLPITDERAALLFALTPIHYRRNDAGDTMYGWHEKLDAPNPVANSEIS